MQIEKPNEIIIIMMMRQSLSKNETSEKKTLRVIIKRIEMPDEPPKWLNEL